MVHPALTVESFVHLIERPDDHAAVYSTLSEEYSRLSGFVEGAMGTELPGYGTSLEDDTKLLDLVYTKSEEWEADAESWNQILQTLKALVKLRQVGSFLEEAGLRVSYKVQDYHPDGLPFRSKLVQRS